MVFNQFLNLVKRQGNQVTMKPRTCWGDPLPRNYNITFPALQSLVATSLQLSHLVRKRISEQKSSYIIL